MLSSHKIENPHQPPEPATGHYFKHPAGTAATTYQESPQYKLEIGSGPQPDTFEYAGRHYDAIDPDKDAYGQLRQAAEDRGNPGMVGLEWVEGDGMRYRVRDYQQIARNRPEVKKALLPRIAKHSIAGPELERPERRTGKYIPETIEQRTVEVIAPDGTVVDMMTFTGTRRERVRRPEYLGFPDQDRYGRKKYRTIDVFQEHFTVSKLSSPNAYSKGTANPRDIVGFRWTEVESRPEPRHKRYVAARGVAERGPDRLKRLTPEEKTQRQFESLTEEQAALGLEDWRGLTWTSPSTRREAVEDDQGNRRTEVKNYGLSRINRDFLVMRKHKLSGETYVERMFDVVTRNGQGVVTGRSLYTMSRLWELFRNHEKRDRKLRKDDPDLRVSLDLRWEVGIDPKETARAILPRTVDNVERTGADEATYFQIDSENEEEPPEDETREYEPDTESPTARYVQRAREWDRERNKVIGEIGSDRLREIVGEIQDVYEQDIDILERLGIESKSLPGEYILMMQTPAILNKLMERRLQGDTQLFDDTPMAKARRIRDAEDELGKVFIGGALKTVKHQVPDPESDDPKAKKTMVKRVENQDVLGRIRHFIFRQEIERLLEKELENNEPVSALTPDEHANVGRMLRRSIGRIP